MARTFHVSAYLFVLLVLISRLMSISGKLRPWNNSIIPDEIFSLDIATRLRVDQGSITKACSDFGKHVHEIPSAVFYPSSVIDIADLVKFSYNSSTPFTIAARGHGHSVRGQAMARNGVVVDMTSLNNNNNGGKESRIRVSWSDSIGYYADVGGEQLWIDVLRATLEHGVAPVSWTDYLYLTVGGTLSNAGISGQSYKYGPQISNVHQMDVITGKGEVVTCSREMNPDLFFAVLGGLGQFGIITRARIALEKAPSRVKWMRMLYDDFSTFTKDQEHLISINGLDYIEGSLYLHENSTNNWRSSFFSSSQQSKITSLLAKHGIIYCLEVVKYYHDDLSVDVNEELQWLLEGRLSFIPGFIFKKDASFVDFLNRVRDGELKLQSRGQWDVPHPWLNLFVPKSAISDFNAGVFIDIIYRKNKTTTATILVYPTSRKTWDDRTSAVIPDEDTFYSVGLLHSSGFEDWEALDSQNNEILEYCDKVGIKIKQYLPHYKTRRDRMKHFGSKWNLFQERKAQFDPKLILSPGQKIFNN